MKILSCHIICLLTAFFSLHVKGQNNNFKKIEKDLLYHFNRINYWTINQMLISNTHIADSIELENKIIEKKLKEYTNTNPSTIKYPFPELKKAGLSVITSNDGSFRIYSWDTESGGTEHLYNNIFQIKNNGRTISFSEDDDTRGYSKIFTLALKGKTIYLATYDGVYATLLFAKGIKLFTIEKNTFNDSARLIKTGSGLQNELSYEYHPSLDRTITFDSSSKTIYLPFVLKGGTVTKKIIKYRFTGNYFEKIK